jgi:tetratricopeptide (TPR) repeat protein
MEGRAGGVEFTSMLRAHGNLAAIVCATLLLALPARSSTPEQYQVSIELGRLEALLGRAHYREAAEKAPLLRSQALALPPSEETRRLVIRAELVAGTAALALGQEAAARQCFLRALQLDPRLTLDPSTPPKVRRTFEAVRGMAR